MSNQKTKTIYWHRNIEHDFEAFSDTDFGAEIPEKYITLGKCEVAIFDMCKTDEEIIAFQVATLNAQKDKVRATAHIEITRIENKIQSLLSITHQVEA